MSELLIRIGIIMIVTGAILYLAGLVVVGVGAFL